MSTMAYLSENLRFFKFLAYNKLDPSASFWRRLLHMAVRIMANALCADVILFSSLSALKGESPEFNILNTGIYFAVVIRLNYQYAYEDKPARIVETMNTMFKPSSCTGLEEVTMARYKKMCRLLMKVSLFADVFTIAFMVTMPLLIGSERVLPLPTWYPYDWTQSPWYEITYSIQTAAQICIAMSYFNSDLFVVCTLFLTTGQFKILGWEFKNVVYKILLQNNVPEEIVSHFRNFEDKPEDKAFSSNHGDFIMIYMLLETERFKDDISRHFTELVRFHQRLLTFCDEMGNFFSPLLFLSLSCSTFHMIFIEFVIVTTGDKSLRMGMILYLFGVFSHSFWPVLFGQLLRNQSEKLMNDLYELPWFLCDKKFRTNFRLAHVRMSKPFAVTMAKLTEVNLSFFSWMVRTSFSYFTILRQVTQEQ